VLQIEGRSLKFLLQDGPLRGKRDAAEVEAQPLIPQALQDGGKGLELVLRAQDVEDMMGYGVSVQVVQEYGAVALSALVRVLKFKGDPPAFELKKGVRYPAAGPLLAQFPLRCVFRSKPATLSGETQPAFRCKPGHGRSVATLGRCRL